MGVPCPMSHREGLQSSAEEAGPPSPNQLCFCLLASLVLTALVLRPRPVFPWPAAGCGRSCS